MGEYAGMSLEEFLDRDPTQLPQIKSRVPAEATSPNLVEQTVERNKHMKSHKQTYECRTVTLVLMF